MQHKDEIPVIRKSIKRYEYKRIVLDLSEVSKLENHLNKYGDDGWKLHSIFPKQENSIYQTFLLERQIN